MWIKLLAAIPSIIKLITMVALYWAGKKAGISKMELKGLEVSNELNATYAKILSNARSKSTRDTTDRLSGGSF